MARPNPTQTAPTEPNARRAERKGMALRLGPAPHRFYEQRITSSGPVTATPNKGPGGRTSGTREVDEASRRANPTPASRNGPNRRRVPRDSWNESGTRRGSRGGNR